MTAVALFGAAGRMGRAVTEMVSRAADLRLVGAVDHIGSPAIGRDAGEVAGVGNLGVAIGPDVGSALLGADVVIDFSNAEAFDGMLRSAEKARVAVVSGTTRLGAASQALIDRAAETIPVLWSPNMSLGVQLMARLVRQAAEVLRDYDIEIVEAHHNNKTDAPSGTATLLFEAVRKVRSEAEAQHGREGQIGARKRGEIGLHALRGGAVVGDHSVHFLGPFDRLEISHRAMGRELFAAGAVAAARFVVGRAPGRYGLGDVIGG
jgi:4-hydroxy-tetrahydrodipicolinate reductase